LALKLNIEGKEQKAGASGWSLIRTFAILYREVRHPDAIDLQLIENASHIAGITIDRHMNQKALRHEHDCLVASGNYEQHYFQARPAGFGYALSTNLLSVTHDLIFVPCYRRMPIAERVAGNHLVQP
jgi:hypothetical protein